jgi:predicted transcriptional regulator of viral defense system
LITFAKEYAIMTLRNWVNNNELKGTFFFSYEDALASNPSYSEQNVKNSLYRLCKQKKIALVYKGFYVIIPTQYALKGIVPAHYYINQLMRYLGKPYYISLLSAAELHGAAHQRPQKLYVTTQYPVISTSQKRNNQLIWIYRKSIPDSLLERRNSETGTITFSGPELTAVDLIQNERHIGGLSRAAEVLTELCEKTDFSNSAETLFPYVTVSAIQRLGYILENVIEETEQADILFEQLKQYGKRLNYIPLSHRTLSKLGKRNARWNIIINTQLELDEI